MDCFIFVKTCYEIGENILITSNLHPLHIGFNEQDKQLSVVALEIQEIDYGILDTLIIYASINQDENLTKTAFEDSRKNDKELLITIQIMF